MFGLVSKKWKQISEQGRPGITRRIEDALRDTNNEWVLVNFPDEIGDVMFSPNFEALSRDERNTAGREFFDTLKPPIKIQARSELLNPRFWIILLGPPISLGVPMLLVAWIVLGFRGSAIPALAHAQSNAAKPTKADAQNVVQMITSDKVKTQAYCDLTKLEEQVKAVQQNTDPKTVKTLTKQAEAPLDKLGPEYSKLTEGLEQVDPKSSEGKELMSILSELWDRKQAEAQAKIDEYVRQFQPGLDANQAQVDETYKKNPNLAPASAEVAAENLRERADEIEENEARRLASENDVKAGTHP
jgi:hypothetical protein